MPSASQSAFRPRLLAALVVVALALLLALGTWQLRRLDWKEGLIAVATLRLSASPVALPRTVDWSSWDFRRITVSGRYRHEAALGFGLSARGPQIGAHLLTPLVLEDGRTVLVDRGWMAEDQLPPDDPTPTRPAGLLRLEGVARVPDDDGRNLFTPADDPVGRRVYGYDWPMLERLTGLELLPVVLRLQAPDNPTGSPIPEPTTVNYRNPHLGYAVTWYGLAITLAVVYLVFRRRQRIG